MGNVAFDQLVKRQNLKSALQTLSIYEAARARTNLASNEIEFLDRAVAGARESVEVCQHYANSWHL